MALHLTSEKLIVTRFCSTHTQSWFLTRTCKYLRYLTISYIFYLLTNFCNQESWPFIAYISNFLHNSVKYRTCKKGQKSFLLQRQVKIWICRNRSFMGQMPNWPTNYIYEFKPKLALSVIFDHIMHRLDFRL